MKQSRGMLHRVLLLLLLVAPLQGCWLTFKPPTPCQCPRTPEPPSSLMQPVPQESFSERAQRDIETWLQELTRSETK